MGNLNGMMVESMKVVGLKANSMELGFTEIQMEKSKRESGLMAEGLNG